MNPYKIDEEPCVISFSGGRTSAYMLNQFIKANDGILPDNYHALFCNTGKECEETLAFVQRCRDEWETEIVWLEYAEKKTFKQVDYGSASRNGEPFEQLITDRNCLPNSQMRFCTGELKVLTIDRYMKSIGINDYTTAIGIRADEPLRVVKMRAKEDYIVPLASENIGVRDIRDFWEEQGFNLELPTLQDGKCLYSNCDLCFLKGHGIKLSLIHEGVDPDWWIEQENRIGARFRNKEPNYQAMKDYNGDQFNIFDESIPCFCGD